MNRDRQRERGKFNLVLPPLNRTHCGLSARINSRAHRNCAGTRKKLVESNCATSRKSFSTYPWLVVTLTRFFLDNGIRAYPSFTTSESHRGWPPQASGGGSRSASINPRFICQRIVFIVRRVVPSRSASSCGFHKVLFSVMFNSYKYVQREQFEFATEKIKGRF